MWMLTYCTVHVSDFWCQQRGWKTSDFLKSTVMWLKSSQLWLIADYIINKNTRDGNALQHTTIFNKRLKFVKKLWCWPEPQARPQTRVDSPCKQLWHTSQCGPQEYCSYLTSYFFISSFVYALLHFLQISAHFESDTAIKWHSKITFIWMH